MPSILVGEYKLGLGNNTRLCKRLVSESERQNSRRSTLGGRG